jgi:hypothetical protein
MFHENVSLIKDVLLYVPSLKTKIMEIVKRSRRYSRNSIGVQEASFENEIQLGREMSEGELLDLKPNRNSFLYCSSMTNKIIPHMLVISKMTFGFEYLERIRIFI